MIKIVDRVNASGFMTKFYKMPKTGISSASLVIHAGAFNDFKGKEDIAHYIEHCVFKGSKVGDAVINNEYWGKSGISCNAMTCNDMTVYYFSGLSSKLNIMIEELFKLIDNAKFPEDEVEKERNVVLTEHKMRIDAPLTYFYDTTRCEIFNQPYGGKITSVDSINNITVSDMFEFYDKYYCKKNMELHIATDKNIDNVIGLIDKLYSNLNRPEGISYKSRPYNILNDNPVINIPDNEHSSLDYYGRIYTIDIDNGNKYYGSILAELIGGEYGILKNDILREELGAVYSSGNYNLTTDNNGRDINIFYASFNKDNKEKVISAIEKFFKFETKITQKQFDKAKNKLLYSVTEAMNSIDVTLSGPELFKANELDFDFVKTFNEIKKLNRKKFNDWYMNKPLFNKQINLNKTIYMRGCKED